MSLFSSNLLVRTFRRPVPAWTVHVADAVGIAMIGLFLVGFVDRNFRTQCDLRAYKFAGMAVLRGIDPYAREHLTQLAGGRPIVPFLYPAVTLLPCMAIANVPWLALAWSWIWIKIGILAALVGLWSFRLVRRRSMVLPMALLAVFGWNASAQWDLGSGNVAILEAALVWAGLAFYVAGRRAAFAALIVVAALFKLAPAAFLLLLLVPSRQGRRSGALFVTAIVVLAALVAAPLLIGPASHFGRFWREIPNWGVTGLDNPAAVALVLDIANGIHLNLSFLGKPIPVLWCLYALALVLPSLPFLKHSLRERDPLQLSMVAALLYTLLMPRPVVYGFVIVVPVVLFFAPRPFDSSLGRWALVAMFCAQGFFRLTSIFTGSLLAVYAPFLLNLCVWMLVIEQWSREHGRAALRSPVADPLLRAA